ncbi:MAG: DUF3298 domain-containing protein [Clostridia bacterium]|nr:DUF3298 domain-containing protein [Clostridia bacterium]
MKKGICLLLMFSVLLTLCSCEKQDQQTETLDYLTVDFTEQYQEEAMDGGSKVSVQWQQLNLSEEDAKNYPNLKKALDTYNENMSLYADENMMGLRESALSMIPYREHPITLYLNTGVYLQRADSRILSFLEQNDIYSGGMHPNHYYNTYNFDSVTGEEILLTDVITDMDILPELLSEKLIENYPDVVFFEEELPEYFAEYEPTDYRWTLDYQGLTVWFSPYEVASYADGFLNVKLYFEEEPELFKETYKNSLAEN